MHSEQENKMNTELIANIASLLEETGKAHHAAFAATDGDDPEWPIWYADYTRDRLASDFGFEYTKSQLIYCLMRADLEHQARAPGEDWVSFYAREMVEHCAPSPTPAADTLSLYYYDGCPFCGMVRQTIDHLGIDVELRNILFEPGHRGDLVEARGRATVPVLRITSPDGDDRWMPESRDIIQYLQKTYG